MTSQSKVKLSRILLFAGISLQLPAALAVFEPGIGIGFEYSDNAGLTPDNEDEDLILLGQLAAKIEQTSGSMTLDAATSVTYENYTDDTFSDQYYFDLNATAGWEMIPGRVNWVMRDFFTQRLEDSIDRSTPNNIEDVNIFNVAPDITMPISRVQRVVVTPSVSDFYYEDSDTDNQRYSLSLDWLYSTSATNEVGLGSSISKTSFEDEDKNPDFSASNIHAVISGELARSKYIANLGYTHIDRDVFENRSAPTGSLDWVLGIAGRTEARVYLATDLTDSSYSALGSAIDPGIGDVDNEQISGDIYRNNIARGTFTRRGATLKSRLWAEIRDLDYKEAAQDREVQNLGLKFDYQMRALMSSALYAKYKRTKRTEQNRTDKQYVVGGQIGYQLARKLRTVFNLQYQDKDSTENADEFSEFSGLIGLVYGYGHSEVARKRARGF